MRVQLVGYSWEIEKRNSVLNNHDYYEPLI
jgi:hypothetical protein